MENKDVLISKETLKTILPAFQDHIYRKSRSDFAQYDETQPDYIKNRTHYDSRRIVKTEPVTVTGNTTVWYFIRVADSINFDINKLKYLSRSSTYDDFIIEDLPIEIVSDYGGFTLYDPVEGMDWGIYFTTQEEADRWYGDENSPFTPGLYMYVEYSGDEEGNGDGGDIPVDVTYSLSYEAGEIKTLNEKYIKYSHVVIFV